MRIHPGLLVASVLTSVATAIVILALAVVVFLNPAWVGFAQERADAAGWTGYDPADVRSASNAILFDLVVGPPDFDVAVGGRAVLGEDERGHMRDVRTVFAGAAVLAGLAAVWLLAARALQGPAGWWTAVRRGALGLVAVTVGAAAVVVLAFDAAFEVFHRLFFAAGNWAFDPATSRLVQLFPMQFWYETTVAVGLVAVLLALGAAWVAGRRRGERAPSTAAPSGVMAGNTR